MSLKNNGLNTLLPLLRWFYQQTKNHTTTNCFIAYKIMLFTDGCPILGE